MREAKEMKVHVVVVVLGRGCSSDPRSERSRGG